MGKSESCHEEDIPLLGKPARDDGEHFPSMGKPGLPPGRAL
ncbi:MAG TPA: hypothetical protein VJ919_08425 [Tangfeifania sp.]|nr:hypothetical protein [Tangfeifania sp.]